MIWSKKKERSTRQPKEMLLNEGTPFFLTEEIGRAHV